MSDCIESMLGCEVTREADPVAQNQDSGLAVQQAFEELRGPTENKVQSLAQLFSDLNYEVVLEPLSTTGWSKRAQEAVACKCPTPPQILAAAGHHGQFKVIYVPLQAGQRESARLRLTDERAIAQQVLSERAFPDSLLVFSDPKQQHWHFVNPRLVSETTRGKEGERRLRHILRRIAVGPEDKLRTAIERFSHIRLSALEADTLPAAQIHDRHNEAFNVERVTVEFFQGFKKQFLALQKELLDATDDLQSAHDYALRLLSRIMFVYFIQRKRWLGDDPDFMTHYWQAYLTQRGRKPTGFFSQWLEPLFFEAFASPAEASLVNKRDYMPADLRETLRNAPYLNGGLFSRDDLDLRHSGRVVIHDEFFEGLLDPADGFFERYNFTISEDSPLDQEVAVDPEMIGHVYESLVNISEPGSEAAEDRTRQREAGIFYTAPTEIDLMCRLALSDYLRNHLGDEHRDLIYELVFSLEPDEKAHADQAAADLDLWPRLGGLIRGVTVVDPACGSGSFLVGMMNILFDLRQRAAAQIGVAHTANEAKREIIGYNLYGVDVMQWAVEIAELRLWLQLVVHTELEPGELQGPRPLLPNLSFKIRQGDSLVQEVAGVNLAHLKTDVTVPTNLRGRLRKLQDHKLAFYEAKEHYSPEAEDEIRKEERKLFLDILHHKATALEQQVQRIAARLGERQRRIDGTEEDAASPEERRELEQQREQVEAQLESVGQAHAAILKAKQVPFVWDLAFVEIFEGDTRGFDIVIGNPPYVERGRIGWPQRPLGKQSKSEKDEYKAALSRSVIAAHPAYFRAGGRAPGRMADLYVYFYLHGLSLLNPEGAFCFITSNSWMDAGFAGPLREFLARQVPVHFLIESRAKRVFAQAAVNTVIALLAAPAPSIDGAIEHITRFVSFTCPFDAVSHPAILSQLDEATESRTTPEYTIRPVEQVDLLEPGDEGVTAMVPGVRPRAKWGGHWFRAPSLLLELLEEQYERFVALDQVAEVKLGITSGANDWFYLSPERASELGIEEECLIPVLKSPRNVTHYAVGVEHCDLLLFSAPTPRSRLLHLPRARRYIAMMEQEGVSRRAFFRGKAPDTWYAQARLSADLVTPYDLHLRHFCAAVEGSVAIDKQLVCLFAGTEERRRLLGALLNGTLAVTWREALGRANFGDGVLASTVEDTARLYILDPSQLPNSVKDGLDCAWRQLAAISIEPLPNQLGVACQELNTARPPRTTLADVREYRMALDEPLFDFIGVSGSQREMLYNDLLSLLWYRIARARSV